MTDERTEMEHYSKELLAWKRKQVNEHMNVLSQSVVGQKGDYQIDEKHRSEYDEDVLKLQFELSKKSGLRLGARDYSSIFHITNVYDALAESHGATKKTKNWVSGSDPRNLEQTYFFSTNITRGDKIRFGFRKAVHGLLGLSAK